MEKTLFETTLENLIDAPLSWKRTEQIDFLISILDEKPALLERALARYDWLKIRNVFSDESIQSNEWVIWNGSGWEKLWKRFLVEVMIVYEKMPESDKKALRISEVKEKYGGLRIYLSSYNDELKKLVTVAEMLSSVTCASCGKTPLNSRGEHLIYMTRGWISYLCRDCFDRYSLRDNKLTKENRQRLKELRRNCKVETKTFKTQLFCDGKLKDHLWVEKFGWLY